VSDNRDLRNSAKRFTYITSSVIQVRVPVPFSLKWINSYLLLEKNGTYTIIDPGLRTLEAEQVWEETLQELSLTWRNCSAIVVTHQHPDHYGLAGYVQQHCDAPVYMTRESKAYTDKLWGTGQAQFERDMEKLLVAHGTPIEIVEAILANMQGFVAKVEPQPVVEYIEAGQTIRLGDRQWLLIHTEGHAYGGIMLYDSLTKQLLCGDQVLPRITPHVGVVAGEDRPVLSQFLANLQQIAKLDVKLVLPGHREPFEGYSERITAIIQHHKRRLASILQYVQEQRAVDSFTCCEWLFGKHLREQPHNMRFALTETIAHLDHLQEKGLLQKKNDCEGLIRYIINE